MNLNYSGGFFNTEDILLKMKFYIQLRDPSLKKINTEGIFNSFSNIWMPLLKDRMNKYLTILLIYLYANQLKCICSYCRFNK